jgi:predicted SAM-dependent methyltransferase
MKEKLPYLNVGCGTKYHADWVNIDMYAKSTDVIRHNIVKGIPYPDNFFEIVYHSQVLEHIQKDKAHDFMKECYRVLKPGGMIRVVVPDLENIIDEYRNLLQRNLTDPGPLPEANYDWIMLELFDQTVRNYSGGLMTKYLRQDNLPNEQYILDRTGYVGRSIRDEYRSGIQTSALSKMKKKIQAVGILGFAKNIIAYAKQQVLCFILGEKYRIGDFRLSGEVHMWMYDRYSLGQLLHDSGFRDIEVKNPYESSIPDWGVYELDVKDGMIYDPTSLFMEARK